MHMPLPLPILAITVPSRAHCVMTSAPLGRHSDWAVTLPLLVIDLYDLSDYATDGAKPWLDKWYAAALMPVIVFLGAVYRFYSNELRAKKDGTVDCAQLLLGSVSFIGSCVLFALVMEAILHPVMNESCGPTSTPNVYGKCPISEELKKNDGTAIMVLTWVWVGYPVVSLISRVALPDNGLAANGWVSFFKDLSYAALDLTAKAGLALYVSFRTLRL